MPTDPAIPSFSEVEERGEWHVWNLRLAAHRPDIARAVQAFRGSPKHPASEVVGTWLRDESCDDRAAVTHVLVVPRDQRDPDIAAFVALASSEVVVDPRTRTTYRSSSQRLPATYVAFIGRHADYPKTGLLALAWAAKIARDVGEVQANLLFVLQAADEPTAAMWRKHGFRASDDGRLWAPFPGRA